MESTSARHGDGGVGRIRTAASAFAYDNQSLITEIRKVVNVMKKIAVDLEKDNQSEMVKELENGVIELLAASDDCVQFSTAVQHVGDTYQPAEEPTDFKKLLENEVTKLKSNAHSVPQNHPLLRQFREAIWNVHHAGQPMPGDEQEDIIMTSTATTIVHSTCPLSGKPVTELTDPVRSMDCKHVYEKKAVMHYIKSKRAQPGPVCPVAGCPKILQAGRVLCDPLLIAEIDELRLNNETARSAAVEDFTALDEDD